MTVPKPLLIINIVILIGPCALECKQDMRTNCMHTTRLKKIAVKCKAKDLNKINAYIDDPKAVTALDLSYSSITEIPPKVFSNFTELTNLNLSTNKIKKIEKEAFFGLENLRLLILEKNSIEQINEDAFLGLSNLKNLSLLNNNIKIWKTQLLLQELPELEVLDIAGNVHFIPDERILSHPKIHTVFFLNMDFLRNFKLYMQCVMTKNISMFDIHIESWSLGVVLYKVCLKAKPVIHSQQFLNVTNANGYTLLCRSSYRELHFLNVPKVGIWYEIVTMDDMCWPKTKKVLILTLSIGILTFLFNFAIITTTLRSRVLRASVAHVLVANLAGGDFLLSIYTIALTVTVQIYSYTTQQDVYNSVCKVLGVFLLAGQIITPLMTFVVTLERYFVIVYCMNSELRIRMKLACITVIISWITSITLSLVGIFTPTLTRDFDNACVPLAASGPVNFLTYPALVLALLYVVTIFLYCHIYLNVRKTNQRTEQQRKDSSLARKIISICLTNILCWIIPLVLSTLITHTALGDYVDWRDKRVLWNSLAPTCIIANSCLNPVLFSFRNEMFCSEFLKQWPCMRSNQIRQRPMGGPARPQVNRADVHRSAGSTTFHQCT